MHIVWRAAPYGKEIMPRSNGDGQTGMAPFVAGNALRPISRGNSHRPAAPQPWKRPAPSAGLPAPRFSPPWRFRSRSEEHTSELQSLMRTSYAVFCLQKQHYIIVSIYNSKSTTTY